MRLPTLLAAIPTTSSLPARVDYLVIGAGATGMAFVDTLLHHSSPKPSVLLVDDHAVPGGQWLDSYEFVRLHQPSDMYGVESMRLEPQKSEGEAHRATRREIIHYYDEVCKSLEERYDFRFVGGVKFDTAQLENCGESSESDDRIYKLSDDTTIRAKKVVDGRYLQPDLPINVAPKFKFNSDAIRCVPVNNLADEGTAKHYVVIGAGKTGMDAIVHLLSNQGVDPDDILWVVPHEAWITARENIGSCMEFLHHCSMLLEKEPEKERSDVIKSNQFFQRGFKDWEKQGHVYRFDEGIVPTKFKDATLDKAELALIKKVKRVVRNGRVEKIDDDGTMHFDDGTSMSLPWSEDVGKTLFVHCSAGAFNYSKQKGVPPPIFSPHRISIQDVYGTPGFCFVGSVIGRLESLGGSLSDEEKNAMCKAPFPDESQAANPLGPSGGDVGTISADHGYVQRLCNLRRWLRVSSLRDWLVGNRLFNLRHLTVEEVDKLVEETWDVLEKCGVVTEES